MRAYKFLAAGALSPFTGRVWSTPSAHAPGAWVTAPPGDLSRYGVHACRAEDLAYWPDEELWLVELGGTLLHEEYQVVASHGRLLHRIAGWNAETTREYGAACAWRARDLMTERLDEVALRPESAALRACIDLESLEATAKAMAGAARRDEPRGLVAYVAGAALRARQGLFREASLQCAHLGAALASSEAAADAERAWQSQWLAQRLQLREIAARWGSAEVSV
jgi:hypothetical protein